MIKRGTLSVLQVEPLRFTPDEFASLVRRKWSSKARIVMIDSVSGYRVQGDHLVSHLHSMQVFAKHGRCRSLINEVETITGNFRATEIGISYIADNIVFLRYMEMQGRDT